MKTTISDIHSEEGEGLGGLIFDLLRLFLACAFIMAGFLKLRDSAAFEVSLLHWELFPDGMLGAMVKGIPIAEILAGWTCLSPRWRDTGLQFLLSLTSVYTLLLIVQWVRGIPPDCGCFGSATAHWSYPALLLRNGSLIAVEVVLIRFYGGAR